MKGVVYLGESEVEVRDFPQPTPGEGEVLVEMKVAGLCGSDLHKYHNTREWAEERKGMISGHEPAGVVVELGPAVDCVSVGDRVCVYHSLGCGLCEHCVAGEPVFCVDEGAFGRTRDGCHADYMLAPARHCFPLPDEFSFAVGAMLACTAGTAFAALRKLPLLPGETLVVFGLGPVGLTGLLMGEAAGFRCVGVDVNPFRIDLARTLSKASVVNAKQSNPVEAILDLTGGRGAQGVLECSGSATARSQTVGAAAKHACIVIVGAGDEDMNLDPREVLRKALTIKGNAVYSMRQYFEAVRFLRQHPLPLDDMVTHRFRIEEAVEAFRIFDSGHTGKVVFDWETRE